MARVVLVHGFTQSAASWRRVAQAMTEQGHDVVALDAPGHGAHADVSADLVEGAGLLAEAGGRGTWVGYSMGGRLALHVALAHPELVERLVVVSVSAGIDDPVERSQRQEADRALAKRIEAIGVDAFLDEWLAQPLLAGLQLTAEDRMARRVNSAAGLASSLRLAGAGAQQPLWDRLGELEMPVLAVAGRRDTRYMELALRLVEAIGTNATLVVIPDAGHACHLEQPDAFLRLVLPWLAEQD